jgi:hypothetical protein
MWVAELTSHVAWRPKTMRRKMPQNTIGQPPTARRISPTTITGTKCQVFSQR